MKILAASILGLFLVFVKLCESPHPSPTPTPTPPQVTLSSVVAKFHTTSNDKDDNTKLDVELKKNDDTVVADSLRNTGHYNNNTDKDIPLTTHGTQSKSDLLGSKLKIHIAPTGNDKWEFNVDLVIKWSDGTATSKSFNGNVLTQDDPDMIVNVM
jgi:hypothetical protein